MAGETPNENPDDGAPVVFPKEKPEDGAGADGLPNENPVLGG